MDASSFSGTGTESLPGSVYKIMDPSLVGIESVGGNVLIPSTVTQTSPCLASALQHPAATRRNRSARWCPRCCLPCWSSFFTSTTSDYRPTCELHLRPWGVQHGVATTELPAGRAPYQQPSGVCGDAERSAEERTVQEQRNAQQRSRTLPPLDQFPLAILMSTAACGSTKSSTASRSRSCALRCWWAC